MSTTPVTPAKPEETQPTTDPYVLLQQVGGPTKEQIEYLKGQSPNGRVRRITLDSKRMYVLRD